MSNDNSAPTGEVREKLHRIFLTTLLPAMEIRKAAIASANKTRDENLARAFDKRDSLAQYWHTADVIKQTFERDIDAASKAFSEVIDSMDEIYEQKLREAGVV